MAIKRKIDKASFDKLSKDVQEHYTEKDGDYLLDADDAKELLSAKEREAAEAAKEKKRRKELEAELAELKAKGETAVEDAAKKAGDIEAIEKSWQAKLDKANKENGEKYTKLQDYTKRQLVDSKAAELAAEISTSPTLMLPHIKARMAADFDGDEPITRILGIDGKLSALSMEDLKKEMVANKDFSTIIKASNASGSSAPRNGHDTKPATSSAAPGQQPQNPARPAPFDPVAMKEQIAARIAAKT